MLEVQRAEKTISLFLFTVHREIRFRWGQGQAWQPAGAWGTLAAKRQHGEGLWGWVLYLISSGERKGLS